MILLRKVQISVYNFPSYWSGGLSVKRQHPRPPRNHNHLNLQYQLAIYYSTSHGHILQQPWALYCAIRGSKCWALLNRLWRPCDNHCKLIDTKIVELSDGMRGIDPGSFAQVPNTVLSRFLCTDTLATLVMCISLAIRLLGPILSNCHSH